MCGIAGVYNHEAPCSEASLHRFIKRLTHRGPDATGIYMAGTLGMVHTRLSIIDLSSGNQPLINQGRTLYLVANGEIYNYVELRRQLEAKGHHFATQSDSETILHAYAEWGTACLDRLYGMFAFALFDVNAQKLLLVRDRLGIKPLFIRTTSEGIHFSSELAPLVEEAGRADPDTAALGLYLQHNFISGSKSIVQGATKILPGQAVEVHRGRVSRQWTYWNLTDVESANLNYHNAARRFDDLMAEVIPQHLRSDVPFGAFLSGGTDSAILVAMIRRYSNQSLRTYSVGFRDNSVHNELAAARRVAELFHTEHTELEMDERELLGVLPETIAVSGELMADYANLPTYLLAARAGQDLKVIFTGEGGDEVFAGYGRYRVPRLKRLWRFLLHPSSGGYRPQKLSNRFPAAKLLPGATYRSTHQPFIDAWKVSNPRWSALQKMQFVDITTWLTDDLLVKTDRMLMAHGLEGRVPFLDHRIVEFGMSLSDALKIRGRIGKSFLRRWAEQFLPKKHLSARKAGFTVPVREWLRGDRMQTLSNILNAHACIQNFLYPQAVRGLLHRHVTHGTESAAVWALLQWGLWYERFVVLAKGPLHGWITDA